MMIMKKFQKGSGLVEVMVSLIVTSVGVLGALGLQTRSMQLNQGSMYLSQAVVLVNDMVDRMRANGNTANLYVTDFDEAAPEAPACGTVESVCSASQMADFDLAQWKANLAAVLPQGQGAVQEVNGLGPRPVYVVTVQFEDSRMEAAAGQSDGMRQFSIRTEL